MPRSRAAREDSLSANRITDEVEAAAYLASARELYALDGSAIEIADPPIVVRTPGGAKIMAWLPVEEEDRT